MTVSAPMTLEPATPSNASLIPPTMSAVCAAALCVVVPLLVISGTSDDGDSAWALALVVVVIAGARFSWLFGNGRARLMEFSFWTFTYIFMGLAPLVQFRSGIYPGTTGGLALELNEASMVVVLVGILAAIIGVCVPWSPPRRQVRQEILSEKRVLALAIGALIISTFYVMRIGPSVFLESRSDLSAVKRLFTSNTIITALIGAISTVPLLVSCVALLSIRREVTGRRRQLITVLAVLTGGGALFVVNPISSPRYMFGTFLLSVLAGLGAYATASRVRTMTLGFLVGMVAVFPTADLFRRTSTAVVDINSVNPLVSLTSGDFDAFAQLNNTLLYVGQSGITWGNQALGVVLFWVPRDFWPGKPVDTGILLADFRQYQFTNLSAPLWAEFYINLGIVGVILGMILVGFWMRNSDGRTSVLLGSGKRPTLVALILPFYLIMILRGSLLQAMSFLTLLMFCTFVVRRRRRSEPAGLVPLATKATGFMVSKGAPTVTKHSNKAKPMTRTISAK